MHANSKLAEPCRQSLFQIPQEVLTRHRNLGLEHVCRKMQTQSVLWQILLIAMYSIPMQANSKVLQPCRQSLLLNTPRGLNQTSPQFGFRTYPPEKCRRNQYYGKYWQALSRLAIVRKDIQLPRWMPAKPQQALIVFHLSSSCSTNPCIPYLLLLLATLTNIQFGVYPIPSSHLSTLRPSCQASANSCSQTSNLIQGQRSRETVSFHQLSQKLSVGRWRNAYPINSAMIHAASTAIMWRSLPTDGCICDHWSLLAFSRSRMLALASYYKCRQ
jgi:hypothetical protein